MINHNSLRLLPYISIVVSAVVAMVSVVSCGGKKVDPLVVDRHMAVDTDVRGHSGTRLYADPSGAEAISIAGIDSALDEVEAGYFKSLLALSRLLQGDVATCDSLFREVSVVADAFEDDEPLLKEYLSRCKQVRYNIMGLNDSAIVHGYRAYDASIKAGNYVYAVENLSSVGEFQSDMGYMPQAAATLRRAIAMADSIGYNGRRSLPVMLAAVYSAIGNWAEADRYYGMHQAKIGDYSPAVNFFYYNGKGNSYYYRKMYDEAVDEFRMAQAIADSLGDPYMMAMCEVNLGEALMYAGRLDSADMHINSGVEKFENLGVNDRGQAFYISSLLGELALRKGDSRHAALRLSSALDNISGMPPRYVAVHYGRMRDYYRLIGDFRNAYNYQTLADSVKMSLFDESNRNYAAELEYRYMQDTTLLNSRASMAKKEEEVMRLRQGVWAVVALVVALVAVGWAYIFHMSRKKERAFSRMKTRLMAMRMENARNRISPHFIFNVLNNELAPGSDGAIPRLVDLMRKNLELSNRTTVTLAEELDFIARYVDTERMVLGDDFTYTCTVSPDIDMSQEIPSMLLQIFVENAVKHGLRGYCGGKMLEVKIESGEDGVTVTITNNGNMVSPAKYGGTGTGLRIVNQTMHLLNELNHRKMTLSHNIIEDGGMKYYRVTIVVPSGYDFTPIYDNYGTDGE